MKLALVLTLAMVPSLAVAEAPPPIKMVSTGKAPMKALRLEWKKGVKATYELVQEEWVSRNGRGGPMTEPEPKPKITTTLDLDVTEVRAKGDVRLEIAYRKIEADASKKPDVAKKMNAFFGPLAGSKGFTVVNARGVALESDMKPPTGSSAQLAKQLDAMRSISSQILVGYPEEAVGVGAKWESSSTVRTPDPSGAELVIEQNTTYELVELAGAKGKLAVAMTGKGKSKDGKLSIEIKTKGEVAFDLASPIGGSGRVETLTIVKLDAGGSVALTQANTSIVAFTSRAR